MMKKIKHVYFRWVLDLKWFKIYGPWELGWLNNYAKAPEVHTLLQKWRHYYTEKPFKIYNCLFIEKQDGTVITIREDRKEKYKL